MPREATTPGQGQIDHRQSLLQAQLCLLPSGKHALRPEQARVSATLLLITTVEAVSTASYLQVMHLHHQVSVAVDVPPAPSSDQQQASNPKPFQLSRSRGLSRAASQYSRSLAESRTDDRCK